jgi:hypothetical protein
VTQLLIDASADLNGQGFLGAQLHVAAFSGHRAGSGLLIAWGRTAGMTTRLSCTAKDRNAPAGGGSIQSGLLFLRLNQGGFAMTSITRRSALALSMVAPALALPKEAAATDLYGPDAGKEFVPGIRQIDLGKFPINIGGYKTAMVIDFAAKPGSAFPDSVMKNDMVCVIVTGEYLVKQSGPGAADREFTVKAGGVYSCAKDSHETAKNTGSEQAVMRVVMLMPA